MTSLSHPITLQPAVTTDSFSVLQSIDDPVNKTVRALVLLKESPRLLEWYTVWSGPSYDEAGQWTDTSLNAALKAILEA